MNLLSNFRCFSNKLNVYHVTYNLKLDVHKRFYFHNNIFNAKNVPLAQRLFSYKWKSFDSSVLLGFCKSVNLVKHTSYRQPLRTFFESSVAGINTNVSKDVLIFSYEDNRYFIAIKIFSIFQTIMWTYLSINSYQTLRDAKVPENPYRELKWWEKINFGDNWVRNSIASCCFIVGACIFLVTFMYCNRTVRAIVLHKGGKIATIQTYAFLPKNSMITVPLKELSCNISREGTNRHVPLKIKGKRLFYTLDVKGNFPHPLLFDWTVGLKRKL